jgi:hypothetical protein
MNFFDEISRLERLDLLIRLQMAGNPDDLARKLQVSRRTVLRLIEFLKENRPKKVQRWYKGGIWSVNCYRKDLQLER